MFYQGGVYGADAKNSSVDDFMPSYFSLVGVKIDFLEILQSSIWREIRASNKPAILSRRLITLSPLVILSNPITPCNPIALLIPIIVRVPIIDRNANTLHTLIAPRIPITL